MSDYDYTRYEELLTKIVRDYAEVDDDPDYLEIGTNISGISAVKVIFDGFGLAEEYYYNSRTFQLQDDVVMVQNDDWEYEELSEDDEDYDHVKEKLELFEQYRNGDGPCNPDMQSFAVFIHKDAINDDFEFPEHEFTPWGLIHRTREEVCIYVWWNREDDTFEVLQLEDRLEENSPFDEAGVMAILEKIAADNGFDDEAEAINNDPSAWPFARPSEGETKLNPNAAWPFANATPVEKDEEEEVEYEDDPEFEAAFPGAKIVKQKPEVNNQDVREIMERVVAKHGLPYEVGVRGWITYYCDFKYKDQHIGRTEEGNKGWICVQRDINEYYTEEPGYTNVADLLYVAEAMIDDNCDETSLDVETEDGEGRSVQLINEESDGKSWDFEPADELDMDDIYAMIRAAKIEDGEDEDEINEMDDDDLDINEFLWDKCQDLGGESYYSTSYGVAYLNFDDGFTVGMSKKAGKLYIFNYGGKDVDKDTVFE